MLCKCCEFLSAFCFICLAHVIHTVQPSCKLEDRMVRKSLEKLILKTMAKHIVLMIPYLQSTMFKDRSDTQAPPPAPPAAQDHTIVPKVSASQSQKRGTVRVNGGEGGGGGRQWEGGEGAGGREEGPEEGRKGGRGKERE